MHFARSTDSGASFGEAVEIDASGSYGYVDVELLGNGDAIVSWLRSGAENLALVTRRVTPAGELTVVETAVDIDISRPLDFPQMVPTGERLVFVWTDYSSGSDVKTGVGRFGP
ncbi:MAG: hypothetical protein GWN29_04150 [Gammaproteobacteria bacterium]|nr:hypothetical protein [Gammaproteobacteria bacterium]